MYFQMYDDYEHARRFKTDLQEDEQEMLPIKLSDGTVKRVIKKVKVEVEDEAEDDIDMKPEFEVKQEEDDTAGLSAAQLLVKRQELLEESKEDIAKTCLAITADPEHNIMRFKKLLEKAMGQGVHSLVREATQKLALASLSKAFIEAAPGYPIRPLTDVEKNQTMGKDTKVLVRFEESLLLYYLKYLKLLEKYSKSKVEISNCLGSKIHNLQFSLLEVEQLLMNQRFHTNWVLFLSKQCPNY